MLGEVAPAKVNLFLRVTGRRSDGYHLLDSLAVFADVGDVVSAECADGLALEITGPFASSLSATDDNLVLRAARLLASHAGVPARGRLTLEKRLPVASGIGGGSADAAATMRVLARLWGLALSPLAGEGRGEGAYARKEVFGPVASLGADVPVCLASRPARMGGIGERLSPAAILPEFGLALVNPGVAISTPKVFRLRSGPFSPAAALPAEWADAGSMARDLAALGNDLAAPAMALCPVIGDVLAWLRGRPGCLLAQMSGSGATCFGIFATSAAAASGVAGAPAGWWAWGGGLHSR